MPNNYSAGTLVRALDFPRAKWAYDDTTISNITATSYTTGSPEVAVWFMAPTSGRCGMSISGSVRNNGNADRLFIAARVLEGDPDNGDLFQTPEVKLGVSNTGMNATADFSYHGQTTMLDGLTPGTYYYARLEYRTTLGSGTADIAHRAISIFPIP